MAIAVGSTCESRDAGRGNSYTIVEINNPANATGTIDYICISSDNTMAGIEVASFAASGNNLTTNGNVALADQSGAGVTEYNAPGDFTAFDINIGEYIGIWWTAGGLDETTTSGAGFWYKEYDYIPCTSEAFSVYGGRDHSLYATGTVATGSSSVSSESSSSESSESSSSESSESSSSISSESSSSISSFSSISQGNVCWGHDTDVTEVYVKDFSGNWTGTGTISGSGDDEIVQLISGQYMESETWFVGTGTVNILEDKYKVGEGIPIIEYKTGTTKVNCESDTWHPYIRQFQGQGWVKVKISKG